MALKCVVLSDLHLGAPGARVHKLDPDARLQAAIAAINDRHGDAALCVIAGDLADQGEAAAYDLLQERLQALSVPVALTLGNHDNRESFLEVFGGDQLAPSEHVDRTVDVEGHRIIVLDTAVTGRPGGRLEEQQLDWLSARLDEVPAAPVIVILHHHVLPIGTSVDLIRLGNAPELVEVLARHATVRHVLAGHVHATTTTLWQGIPFTTIAGGHYSLTLGLEGSATPVRRLTGPAQMAIILSDADRTLVHFDNYIDDHDVITR